VKGSGNVQIKDPARFYPRAVEKIHVRPW